MHTVLSLENFQHESDHVSTITNNKRVILDKYKVTFLLRYLRCGVVIWKLYYSSPRAHQATKGGKEGMQLSVVMC